jgi:outer membrane protein OmpA-like peptidoglycan-associated protein
MKYKLIAGAAVGIGLVFALRLVAPGVFTSKVPEKSASTNGTVASAPTQTYDLTASPSGAPPGPVNLLSIPWNGVAPTTFANGGAVTTPDSLIAKYTGGRVNITNQGDYSIIKTEMIKFATGVKNGDANPQGAAFAQIMGDGYPAFLATVNQALPKGQKLEVVYVTGFSYGEDKLMGPPEAKSGADGLRGLLCAAVPYDGDWNIGVKLASDNNIPINARDDTYDKTALNWSSKTSFLDADEAYISGQKETRDEVVDGKKTGKKVTVPVNCVATWTPGDVTVVKKKGGLVTLASTKDYNQQMPAVLIGNKEWMAKHPEFVVNMIKALDRSAFAIRNGDTGFGKTQAAVFGTGGGEEATAEYWIKYYKGYTDTDVQGNSVDLGGSRAVTAAEVREFFGMTPGSYNVYKGVYDVFGKYARDFYPKDVPAIPDYDEAVNTTYLARALQGVQIGAAKAQFTEKKAITTAAANRTYAFEFETGSATLKPSSNIELKMLADQASMTGFRISITGHTDNTGNRAANLALSKARAQSVADRLYAMAPNTFSKERVTSDGYGDAMPKASNDTAEGRADNRRVEVLLGN